MQVYPLERITLQEAMDLQFHIVNCITRHFAGHELLAGGDLGVVPRYNKPETTAKVEQVIADIFQTESALLVRGAGSAAIRLGLHSMLSPGDTVLIHKAPVYPTTETSLKMLGLKTVKADYNRPEDIRQVISSHPNIHAAIIQYTRQKPDDCYQIEQVINTIRQAETHKQSDTHMQSNTHMPPNTHIQPNTPAHHIPILTDDNYAVFKVPTIGVECGADLSCFSAFKLLGPEGIGVIVGKRQYLTLLSEESYSGGMQTQGHEALAVLRGFVYAPVSLAIQAQVGDACVRRLNANEIPGVRRAFLANAQSRVVLVEFETEIAEAVLCEAEKLGAAPHPVGAESKYEIVPMFYRISGTFRAGDDRLERRMIRINPMRAGADTVISILKQAIERVSRCS